GNSMQYHSHKRRDEIWVVIAGEGQAILDGQRSNVKAGDIITMKAGCKHTITAAKELILIEIQLGEEISADDKQKFDLLTALNNASK
ncbi:MAG: cupin domain-containing protein, partial [Lachnospiraceae bacterium]|nr:cupin domain-containing protein [Lachnospiraceae bacterium]